MKKMLFAIVLASGCGPVIAKIKVGDHVPIRETQKSLILRKYETHEEYLHIDLKDTETGNIDSYRVPWKNYRLYANLLTGKIERVYISNGKVDAIVTDSNDPVVTIAAE